MRVLGDWSHADDDDPGLLPCLHIAIGVGDCIKGILPIDDRAEFARLHAGFQEVDKRLGLAAQREREDDPAAPGDRRPDHEQGVLAPEPEIRRCIDSFGLQPSPPFRARRDIQHARRRRPASHRRRDRPA